MLMPHRARTSRLTLGLLLFPLCILAGLSYGEERGVTPGTEQERARELNERAKFWLAQAQPMPAANQQVAQAGPPAPKGRGYIPLTPARRAQLHAQAKQAHGFRIGMKMMFQTLPPSFDCRAKGWATPIGDQGQCGSCYLYSTVQTASAAFVKAGYGKPDGSFMLSPQFGLDCHNFGGCGGGNGTEVIDWMVTNGFPAESYVDLNGNVVHDYANYQANEMSCRLKSGAKLWKPAAWGFCTSDQSDRQPTVDEIKTAMFNYGSLNIALDAGGQFGNGAGTITSMGDNIDHEIQCVAWDDSDQTFLLQNQWGTSWGSGGYRKVTYSAATKHIVDWFWVAATPQPPPPPVPPTPPPTPPGPNPPGPTPSGLTITLSGPLGAGTYEVNPAGTAAAKDSLQKKLDAITAVLQQQAAQSPEKTNK